MVCALKGSGCSAGRRGVALRQRLAFLHEALGEPWPDVGDAALLERVPEWLAGVRRRADLARVDVAGMLRGLLAWEQAKRLDEYAPERVEVPSGSRVRVDYSEERPVLAVKLQELFGWEAAPSWRVDGCRWSCICCRHGAPAAVTVDLASFWRGRVQGGAGRAAGTLSQAPLARGPGERRSDEADQAG